MKGKYHERRELSHLDNFIGVIEHDTFEEWCLLGCYAVLLL
jgi:hypothetical protein